LNARLTKSFAIATAIAAIAVGCGGDDDSMSPSAASGQPANVTVTTSSLSKEGFIKQASAACHREGKGLIGEVSAYLKKHRDDGLKERALQAHMVKAVVLPTVEASMAAVRELGAPAGDEEEVESLLVAQLEAVNEVRRLKKVASFEEVEAHFAEAGDSFRDYGFRSCTYGS
jgi:hypothetical protein